MNKVLLIKYNTIKDIKQRRSIRKYKNERIKKEELNAIIEETKKILDKMEVDKIISPEEEMGIKLAKTIINWYIPYFI